VTFSIDSTVTLSGLSMINSLGSINNSYGWNIITTGASTIYTNVSTGSTTNWNTVDTGTSVVYTVSSGINYMNLGV
jgi:hypothetical protein